MLPNYPEEKQAFMELVMRILAKREEERSPLISRIPKTRIFEGHKQYLKREDGSTHEAPFIKIESSREISPEKLAGIEPANLIEILGQSVQDIARGQSKMLFEHLNQVVEEVGNVVHAGGKPFSAEMILQMLDRIFLPFDDNDNPIFPSIVMNPETAKNIDFVQVSSDLHADARYDELIDRM